MDHPQVVLVGIDLMDRVKIESAVRAVGMNLGTWRSAAEVKSGLAHGKPALAFVDLNHDASDEAILALAAAGVEAIAFGPHVDDVALDRAQALGASQALPRSRFFRSLGEVLSSLAVGGGGGGNTLPPGTR